MAAHSKYNYVRKRYMNTAKHPEDETQAYDKQRQLGSGAFGTVYIGVRKADKTPVAIRQLIIGFKGIGDREKAGRVRRLAAATDGIEYLVELSQHKHLVTILDVFFTVKKSLLVVMEYCSLGNLKTYMATKTNRTEPNIVKIMHQCSEALAYLHSRQPEPMLHRNIKLTSVLIHQDSSDRETVKLGDFGLSQYFNSNVANNTAVNYRVLLDNFQHTSAYANARLPFAPPEVFAALEGSGLAKDGLFYFTVQHDVFALGVVFAFMVAYDVGSDYGRYLLIKLPPTASETMRICAKSIIILIVARSKVFKKLFSLHKLSSRFEMHTAVKALTLPCSHPSVCGNFLDCSAPYASEH